MHQPPIMLVGEAWGEHEARLGAPFVGPSGVLLLRMLGDSGILALNSADKACLSKFYTTNDPKWTDRVWTAHSGTVFRTNVFNIHPHNNDIETLCGGRGDGIPGYPILSKSKYIRAEFEPELERLQNEILSTNPNLILCLGNTPLWVLAGRTGIRKWRGTTLESTHCVGGYKLLPTYHPAAVLRGPELRPITLADFDKALRESTHHDIIRPHRDIWIEPALDDIQRFISEIIRRRREPLSVDIETVGARITCIGFGYSDVAIVVPFDDSRAKSGSYWPSLELEGSVWGLIRVVLSDPDIPKLFQNGLYDIAFLARSVGIRVMGAEEDTMLLHHALQPEMEKSLGFLGSVYADEGAWKHMRTKTKTIKRDA